MLTRPDSQSYTKFLISAGAFLVIAAIVLPGFILRDTDVLTISRSELSELTPPARHEIERRQEVSRHAGLVAPWLAGLLLVAGGVLLASGLPRLRQQEKLQDERSNIELERLRAEFEPQTPDEREERLKAEVVEDLRDASAEVDREVDLSGGLEDDASGSEDLSRQGLSTSTAFFSSELAARARLEVEVLTRLGQLAPPLYELQSQVKVPGSNLYLDALLVGQVDQVPDIVVEIKFAGRRSMKNARNRISEAESQLLRYMSRFRRHSIGWLILVTMEELTAAERNAIEEIAADFRNVFEVTLVTQSEISQLVLPVQN